MNYKDMEKYLIDNTTEEYYKKVIDFTFNSKLYKAEINFAYINTRFDIIFSKYDITYDATYMLVEAMTFSNYKSYMNMIVRKLYDQNVEKIIIAKQNEETELIEV